MGCLEYLCEELFTHVGLHILCPWLNPEPNKTLNMWLYTVLTLLTGIIGIGCSIHHPAGNVFAFFRWISFSLCGYFAILTICYLPKNGGQR